MKFCTDCKSILKKLFNEDNLSFICKQCNKTYKSDNDDTLLMEEVKSGDVGNYSQIILNIEKDRLNPMIKRHCAKCKKETNNNYVFLGDNMIIFYACRECHTVTA
jgi:DNA-directed RNA polymerase subunit M/transcription elongation factor TFIIS